jgi:hypothetical protein
MTVLGFHGKAALATAITLAVLAAGAVTSSAAPQLTKPQYIAKADALCNTALSQIKALAPLYPLTRTAAIGDKWLAIDRRALAKLRALAPPPSDRATAARILGLADVTINKGLASVVAAAKARNAAAYAKASRQFGEMLRRAHAAAAAYGLGACARW